MGLLDKSEKYLPTAGAGLAVEGQMSDQGSWVESGSRLRRWHGRRATEGPAIGRRRKRRLGTKQLAVAGDGLTRKCSERPVVTGLDRANNRRRADFHEPSQANAPFTI